MRYLALLLMLVGCGATPEQLAAGVAGVGFGSVAVIQRTPLDAVVSVVSGRDCSVVRLEQGKTYCRPVEPPPEPQPYCTRSLAAVDCWSDPASVPNLGPTVTEGPQTLTPAQEANRTRRWPDL